MPFRGIRLAYGEVGLFGYHVLFWGRAGVFTSLQAKDIGHGVEKGDRSGCFCHDVFGLGT